MKPTKIVTIGSANIDLVAHVSRMPKPGETVAGEQFMMVPGGKGANQAVAAQRLGAESQLIGRIGDDFFGRHLLDSLQQFRVDTSLLQTTADASTGVALIHVDADGENAITAIRGANDSLTPADLAAIESKVAGADAMLLQLEIPLPTVVAAIETARRHGVITILDPAPVPSQGQLSDLLPVDIISPNASEAEALTGIAMTDPTAIENIVSRLRQAGARQVVLKAGAEGAWLSRPDQDTIDHIPAFDVDVVDTTAAGDAFTAAVAVGYLQGKSLVEATHWAAAAGALACTRQGAQPAMPSRSDVDWLASSRGNTRFPSVD